MATHHTPNKLIRRPPPGTSRMSVEDVTWTRIVNPPESYRIQYPERSGEIGEREILLKKIGTYNRETYYGVVHLGQFKTLRADRVLGVIQLSVGHESSIRPEPTYDTALPVFPVRDLKLRIRTIKGKRTWLVDLDAYTCTCPEKRERSAKGYEPGKLGAVCPHIAIAILENLPPNAGWQPELLAFLANPSKTHRDNLP